MPDLFYLDGEPKANEGRLVQGKIKYAVDGDTVNVRLNETSMLGPDIERDGFEDTIPLKLTGVEAPELGDKIEDSVYENDEVEVFEKERGKYINSEPDAFRALKTVTDLVEGNKVIIDLRTKDGKSNERAITGRDGRPEGIVYFKDNDKWVNLNRTLIVNGYAEAKGLEHSNMEQSKRNEYMLDSMMGVFKEEHEEIDNSLREERDDFLGGFDIDKNARIGDTILPIPPENISMISKNQQEPISVMRNNTQMTSPAGHNAKQIQLDFYFDQEEQINGYKKDSDWTVKRKNDDEDVEITPIYYINGLRSLIAQFKLTPFLPVENTTLNFEYDINAITLQNLVVTNMEQFPNVIQVSLIAKEFNYKVYMDSERPFSYFFDWKLFRFYYQRALEGTDLDFDGDKLPLYNSSNDGLSLEVVDMTSLQELKEAMHEMQDTPNDTAMDYDEGDTEYERKVHDYLIIDTAKKQKDKAHELLSKYNIDRDNFNDKNKEEDIKSFIQEYIDYCANKDNNPVFKNWDGYDFNVLEPVVGFFEAFLGEDDSYKTNFVFYRPFTGIDTWKAPLSDLKFDPHYMLRLRSESSINTINTLVDNTTKYYNPDESGNYYSFQRRYLNNLPETLKKYSSRMEEPITKKLYTSFRDSKGEYDDEDYQANLTYIPSYFFDLIENQIGIEGKTKKEQRDKAIKFSKDKEYNLEWQDIELEDSFLQDVTISMQNRVQEQNISMETKPTHQYMGSKIANINIQLVTQNPFDVNKLTSLIEYVKVMQKRYSSVIERPILKLDNNIVNLFGFYGVQIQDIEVKTVKDLPGTYDVNMSFFGVFRPPKNFQNLSKVYSEQLDDPEDGIVEAGMPSKPKSLTEPIKFPNIDIGHRTQNIEDYLRLKEQLKYINLYPDLYLPKYSELPVESDLYEENSDIFVDPDFYTLTNSNLFVKNTLKILDGFQSGVVGRDTQNNHVKAMIDELGEVDLDDMENLKGDDSELDIPDLDEETREEETYEENKEVKKLYRIISNKISSNNQKKPTRSYNAGRLRRENRDYYANYDIDNTILDNEGYHTLSVFMLANWFNNEDNFSGTFDDVTFPLTSEELEEDYNLTEPPKIMFDSSRDFLDPDTDVESAAYLGHIVTPKEIITEDMIRFMKERTNKNKVTSELKNFMSNYPKFNGLVLASIAQKYYTKYREYLDELESSEIAAGIEEDMEVDTIANNKWANMLNIGHNDNEIIKELIIERVYKENIDLIFKIISLLNAKGYSTEDIANGNSETVNILDNMDVLYSDIMNIFRTRGDLLPMHNLNEMGKSTTRYIVQATAKAIERKDSRGVYSAIPNNKEEGTKNQGDVEERIINSYKDMLEYDQRGRLVRAFPSYYLMLIDEGQEMFIWHLQDVFYHYDGIKSIDVIKDKENVADACYIELFNTKNTLGDPTGGFKETRSSMDLSDILADIIPYESYKLARNKREEEPVSIQLKTGARIHLRMGYGSTPAQLPIVFNGTITEVQLGQIVQFVAQGDGLELTDPIIAGPREITQDGVLEGNLLTRRANPQSILLDPLTDVEGIWANFWRRAGQAASNRLDSNVPLLYAESEYGPNYLGANYTPDFWEGPISERQPLSQDQLGDSLRQSPVTYEIAQNIYNPNASDNGTENINFSSFLYGKTMYDLLQLCAMTVPNWIGEVHPFGMRRSTIFYGHPSFELAYDYKALEEEETEDSDTMPERIEDFNNSVEEEIKTYRQYKVYGSFSDIISNNIVLSQEDIVTAVQPVMYERDKEDIKQLNTIFLDSDIYPEYQTKITVDTSIVTPNIFSKVRDFFTDSRTKEERAAVNYSVSTMRQHLDSMYNGEIIVIGDPTVKPYDHAYIYDLEREMSGPVEVNRVTLSMDSEIGFVSSINPNPVSTANAGFKKDVQNYLASSRAFKTIFVPHYYSRLVAAVGSSLISKMGSVALTSALKKYASIGIGMGALKYSKFMYGAASSTVGSIALQVNKTMKTLSHVLQNMSDYFVNLNTTAKTKAAGTAIDAIRRHLATVYKGLSPSAIKKYVSTKLTGKKVLGSSKLANVINSALGIGAKLKGLPLIVAVMAVEFVVTRSVVRWFRNYRQDKETITIMPLNVSGDEFTAGIDGHQGAVIGDEPGYLDELLNHPIINFFVGENETVKMKKLLEDDLDSTTDLMQDIQQETALGQNANFQKVYSRLMGTDRASEEESEDVDLDFEMEEAMENNTDFVLPINSDIKYYYNTPSSKNKITFDTTE